VHVRVVRIKSNGSAKYVELSVEYSWTRVRFPPPPPIHGLETSKAVQKTALLPGECGFFCPNASSRVGSLPRQAPLCPCSSHMRFPGRYAKTPMTSPIIDSQQVARTAWQRRRKISLLHYGKALAPCSGWLPNRTSAWTAANRGLVIVKGVTGGARRFRAGATCILQIIVWQH
jgi:hypothetical protein